MSCYTCHSELRPDAAYCPYCGARQPDVPECDDYLYSAFISYRHRLRDEEVAQQVQKAIETYVLPKSVAEFYGAPKLQRVFRDADELPTTGSLPDSITEALAKSRALIVVCSPDTPDSRWVQREIDYFASIHGRGKIHLVLADGTSSESIPPALLKRLEVGDDGVVEERDTEPLAADFRPDAVKRARQEKLRVIAALVGCSFDDLAQREQVRRRKLTGIAAGILAVLLIIGAFLVHSALSSQQAADVSEARKTAMNARQLYKEGDRYGALKEALTAADRLPSDADEETVTSVKDALEEALFVNGDESSLWYPAFATKLDGRLSALNDGRLSLVSYGDDRPDTQNAACVSQWDGWFAIADNDDVITTYDSATGKLLAKCEMTYVRKAGAIDLKRRVFDCAGEYLLVRDMTVDGAGSPRFFVACFEARTGKMQWNVDDIPVRADLTPSTNEKYASFTMLAEPTQVLSTVYEVSSGSAMSSGEFKDESAHLDEYPMTSIGPDGRQCYAAVGDTLVGIPYDDGTQHAAGLTYPYPYSISCEGGEIVVSTIGDGDVTFPYAIQAFDKDLNELWSHEGTLGGDVGQEGKYRSMVTSHPIVEGYFKDTGYVVCVGRNVLVLDETDGDVVYERSMDSSIVGATVMDFDGSESDTACVATYDGKVFMLYPFYEDDGHRSVTENLRKCDIGYRIHWADFSFDKENKTLSVTALSAATDDKVVTYSTNMKYHEPEKDDYTLDELKAMAHEVLKADGYE